VNPSTSEKNMMNKLWRAVRGAVAVGSMALLFPGVGGAAPVFGLTGPAAVRAGETLVLNVNASGALDLFALQFSVDFDRSLFRAVSVSEGPFLASGGSTFFDAGTIDNALGTVSFVFDTLLGAGPGVSGSGVLGTLRFEVLGGAPLGRFGLSDVLALNSSLADLGAQTTTYAQAVAEPGTLALFGIAALALLGGRPRRAAAEPPSGKGAGAA
jgi:general secretion pathway protein D